MLPIRNKTIFKSRWWALAWAGGILWSAVDFAGGQTPARPAAGNAAAAPNDTDSPAATKADVDAAVKALDSIK